MRFCGNLPAPSATRTKERWLMGMTRLGSSRLSRNEGPFMSLKAKIGFLMAAVPPLVRKSASHPGWP